MTSEPIKFEPLLHSPDSAGHRLGVSTRSVYLLIAANELRSFKIGKRRLIPDSELQSFAERRLAQAVSA